MNLNNLANGVAGVTKVILAPIEEITNFAFRTIDALMKSLSGNFDAPRLPPKGSVSYDQENFPIKELTNKVNDKELANKVNDIAEQLEGLEPLICKIRSLYNIQGDNNTNGVGKRIGGNSRKTGMRASQSSQNRLSNPGLAPQKKPPQKFLSQQTNQGDDKVYCAYHALKNLLGDSEKSQALTPESCRASSDKVRRDMLTPHDGNYDSNNDSIIKEMTLEYGLNLSEIYKELDVKNCSRGEALNSDRFMCGSNQGGGHWVTYINDNNNEWWRYDSTKEEPTIVGNTEKLQQHLSIEEGHSFMRVGK